MPTPTLESKLLLKADEHVFVLNAPRGQPPAFQQVAKTLDLADAVVVYAVKQKELPRQLEQLKDVRPDVRVWICYPKAGKLDTDLGRDTLWQWMKTQGFEGVRLVNVDDTWSAFWFKR